MPNLTFKEILHNTLSVQSKHGMTQMMDKYILRFASKIDDAVIYTRDGNIYITKGHSDVYPTVVAHTDTVHDIEDKFAVLKHDGVYFGWNGVQQCGVGGDDKVGIAIALWFLQEQDAIKVAFFRDEEIGCAGSNLADMTFFEDSSFVVQCDRRGSEDIVYSIMGQTLFDAAFRERISPIVDRHERKVVTGMMTDVWKLRQKGLRVASMNLSCGYYAPHSPREIVIEAAVENTVDFIHEMISEVGFEKQWFVSKTVHTTPNMKPWRVTAAPVVMHEPDLNIFEDLCPECGQDTVLWEDEVSQYFCYACQQYVDENFMSGMEDMA